jgi:hypothetical protein
MIRRCPRRIQFATAGTIAAGRVAAVLLACCACGGLRNVSAADKAPLSAARLKELANQAIRFGQAQSDPALNRMNGDTMEVKDVGVLMAMDRDIDNPYVRLFVEQIEIDLRRRQLFQRPTSRQLMEPYYVKMEQLIAKKLAAIENSKLSDNDRAAELEKLDDQSMKTFEAGLQAVARSVGKAKFMFVAASGAQMHDVKLAASQKATIDVVRQTTASLLKDAGAAEADYPWSSYQGGETVSMLGDYFCRIRLDGKQATFSKKVGEKTTQLEFPDP